jgi:tRNA1(Val) A37 N6-methylase TrmN6
LPIIKLSQIRIQLMSLFQKSVLKKYLNEQNNDAVQEAYNKFKDYFHNTQIQHNIRESKEEQFQEGFLRELFVNVFGYMLNPKPDFNLTTEFKNEKGAKKADGAILKDGKAIAVIELKSTKTKDLESIRQQAFDYKANQSECVYVITSNFQKIRFYINNAVEFEEFDLFVLSEDRFNLLFLCFNNESLIANLPLKIKNASLLEEENITKKFYADYSLFKKELFESIATKNTELEGVSKLQLYKKTQKLLDRFLFIFFAEDRGLLPPNSISRMIKRWNVLSDEDAYKPLYDIYKQYFGYLNIGRKGKVHKDDIQAYNGGLFLPDEILDSIEIDDEVLLKHTSILTKYDFDSQVDVNILGHIFEHSLNEIESTTAQLEGVDFDKQKSKRKKDGVFYTPKYITKYIVDNTVGKLCEEKKTELGIIDEEYTPNRNKETKKRLLACLDAYRKWLLELTICDPACGSGAFLNQALEFLIHEHHYIDGLNAQLFGSAMVFQDVENQILEKNIFGVDINEESVDIARLSLWLRTAQRGRKLTTLNKNIKCGNSLIDDQEVVGDKAFNWKNEFPEIFKNAGFDVVIGNPPYLRVQGLRENFEKETEFYEKNFESAAGRFDVYVLFMEKTFQLIKRHGVVSFILPHKFLVSDFGEGIRKFFVKRKAVNSIVHFGAEMIFADASAYTCIINLTHNNSDLKFKQILPSEIFNHTNFDVANYESLSGEKWNLKREVAESIFQKLKQQPKSIKDVFSAIRTGVDTGTDELFILEGNVKGNEFHGYSERLGKEVVIESDIVKPMLKGKDVRKFAPITNDFYVIYPHYEKENKTIPYSEDSFKEKFPKAYEYLFEFKDELVKKKIHKKTNPIYWYSLHRGREKSIFQQLKIVTPETSLGGNLTLDYDNYYHNTQVYSLIKNDNIEEDYKFWLTILNSSVFWFFLQQTGAVLRGGYFRFKTKYLEPFPLPKLKSIKLQIPFIDKADLMLSNTKDFQGITYKFTNYLQSQFAINKLSKKLQNWYNLEFGEFIKELNKAIKKVGSEKLSKVDEMDWMEVFETKKAEAQTLKAEIDKTDKEIDKMVYELYGLTKEEIKVVEGENV